MHPVYRVGIADYIKNSVLTVFNSFVYGEKVGRYKFDQLIYQRLRANGADLVAAAVELFYGELTGHYKRSRKAYDYITENMNIFEGLKKRIIESYEDGVFSSRHLTRPEAAHPVVIAGAAAGYTQFSKIAPELIVGMPSGSTELAYAHAFAQSVMKGRKVPVLLFPVSLHSVKHDFDVNDNHKAIDQFRSMFASSNKHLIEKKSVLIVDDNSSTGNTIDCVVQAFSNLKPLSMDVAVAEADTVRSLLNLNNPERKNIASVLTYNHSINILPVSRVIHPKNDLKEIMERRKVIACIKDRYLQDDASLSKTIIGMVFKDMVSRKTSLVIDSMHTDDIIANFRHTFLSNFALVDINYNQADYKSVEHAYQSMKFDGDDISKISSKHFEQINRKLIKRGVTIQREDLSNPFLQPNISAGTSKVIGNQLRILGYVREDWDFLKVPTMTDLLILKFSNTKFYNLLKETGEKYLVEGNDWGDTFWGVDGGRGRNVLGRLLMKIRCLEHQTLVAAAQEISKTSVNGND